MFTRKNRTRLKTSYPRSTKDMPLVDLEVLAQLLDIPDEIPGGVLFQRRVPIETW
jgi:hypothetical protein